MTFESKILAGLGTALALLLSTGVFYYRALVQGDQSQAWVKHTHDVLEAINAIGADMAVAEAGYRGFVWTGDTAELEIWRRGAEQSRHDLAVVQSLTVDNPQQQKNANDTSALLEAEIANIEARIKLSGRPRERTGLDEFRKARGWATLRPLRAALSAMQAEEERLRGLRLHAARRSSHVSKAVVVLGNSLGLLFLSLAALVAGSEMRKRARAEEVREQLRAIAQERAAQLSDSNEELEAFTYTAAHDLRAPLRHMQGFARILQEDWHEKLDEDGRRCLDKILASSSDMGNLLDDLLNFSRLGKTEMHRERVDLQELVERIRIDLEPMLTGRSVTWQIGVLPQVEGDRALLHQVLFNLIANAVKYTRKRAEARIEIGSASEGESSVVVFVRDNGAGFEMQYADKLFGIFQRLHRAEEFEGTGVGLAIVRRIVERHGGRVRAQGAPGEGAQFYISLPLGRYQNGAARVHTAGR